MMIVPKFVMRGMVFLFFKQKTAYEMRISDWSSDVCSSDLMAAAGAGRRGAAGCALLVHRHAAPSPRHRLPEGRDADRRPDLRTGPAAGAGRRHGEARRPAGLRALLAAARGRPAEHTRLGASRRSRGAPDPDSTRISRP